MLTSFREKHKLEQSFELTAQNWFMPLADEINAHQKSATLPYCVAINGCQGSGKSTLSDFLKEYLSNTYGLNVACLSLDDFYLSKSQRTSLAIKVHPLFETRGVPGTHDISQLTEVLHRLSGHNSTKLPRFDKSTDNPMPESDWPNATCPADIIIVEGWCLGVEHQSKTELIKPINALEAQSDETAVWRQYVNHQLKTVYEPLYPQMDYWVMLKAPSFENVLAWRWEQEQKLAKSLQNISAKVMSKQQIWQFIQHYQRLTEHSLTTLPKRCNRIFSLDEHRNIVSSEKGSLS